MSSDIPNAVRREVHQRDEHRCRWCGRTNGALHLHHVDYRSAGGKHVPDNLITLCVKHHQLVHTNKRYYPALLQELLERAGVTGIQLERWRARGEDNVIAFPLNRIGQQPVTRIC